MLSLALPALCSAAYGEVPENQPPEVATTYAAPPDAGLNSASAPSGEDGKLNIKKPQNFTPSYTPLEMSDSAADAEQEDKKLNIDTSGIGKIHSGNDFSSWHKRGEMSDAEYYKSFEAVRRQDPKEGEIPLLTQNAKEQAEQQNLKSDPSPYDADEELVSVDKMPGDLPSLRRALVSKLLPAGNVDEMIASVEEQERLYAQQQGDASAPSDVAPQESVHQSAGFSSVYLDQVLKPKDDAPVANVDLSDHMSDAHTVFLTERPEVVSNTATGKGIPFKAIASFNENDVLFSFAISGRSYIYADSLSVEAPRHMKTGTVTRTESVEHEDSQGKSQVFFDGMVMTVPVHRARKGDIMTVTFLGCDENGICYPPQHISIRIPHDLVNTEEALQSEGEGNSSVEAIQSSTPLGSDGDGLASTLSENLLLGLLLCFLLGIGLDLTPCVLPMLPVFSAMIVGSAGKSGAKQDSESSDGSQGGQGLLRRALKGRDLKTVLIQNSGYTIGLSVTYMILGLLFASLGASLHSVLQHPAVIGTIALLLVVFALSCADVIEIRMPNAVTSRLTGFLRKIKTNSFGGAMAFGSISALIASPCTSAPLAGALLYVMTTGNSLTGALCFLFIGLGMAFPLFLIGIFGTGLVTGTGKAGIVIKKILAIVMIGTAYYLAFHILGKFRLIVLTMLIYLLCVYVMQQLYCLFMQHRPRISAMVGIAVLSLVPSYVCYINLENALYSRSDYEMFTRVHGSESLTQATKDKYTFMIFTADWCTNCKTMLRDVYATDHFIVNAGSINKVVVDISDTDQPWIREALKKYGIVGVPSYVVLDPEDNVIERQLGVVPGSTVYASLRMIYNLRQTREEAEKAKSSVAAGSSDKAPVTDAAGSRKDAAEVPAGSDGAGAAERSEPVTNSSSDAASAASGGAHGS